MDVPVNIKVSKDRKQASLEYGSLTILKFNIENTILFLQKISIPYDESLLEEFKKAWKEIALELYSNYKPKIPPNDKIWAIIEAFGTLRNEVDYKDYIKWMCESSNKEYMLPIGFYTSTIGKQQIDLYISTKHKTESVKNSSKLDAKGRANELRQLYKKISKQKGVGITRAEATRFFALKKELKVSAKTPYDKTLEEIIKM